MFLQTHNRAPIETRKQPNFEGTLKKMWHLIETFFLHKRKLEMTENSKQE